MLLAILVVAICGGCASLSDTSREVHALPSTTPTAPDVVPPLRPPRNTAVTLRVRSALTGAGVTGLRTTPGYENEPNTAIEGTWRHRPVLAYAAPTALIPRGGDDQPTTVSRRTVQSHLVEFVRGQHSSIQMLRFNLGPDTWLLASVNRDRATSGDDRTLALAAVLLAESPRPGGPG